MNESQIDLAHTVALGSIGDEDQRAVQRLLDAGDPALRADFTLEVQQTREALALFAAASATAPPAALRDRVLNAIAADQAPATVISLARTAARNGNGHNHAVND
ncbi:RskA family anti-sigma factor [Nocardia otitidiscaviarum]|uniref:RskA family anti-sigma factor n=1 Tax=Nocardia otitidiscaviarum TaxID=1823 RepID=UPI001E35471C|nr:hypothetical protein [Nocardia otitidiscaviarum]MCP9620919.1 hypothetical protein [Nocardia otitidiscaviarum]